MSATPAIPTIPTTFDNIGNFFKETEDADKNSWNPVIFFGILLIATMPFVNQPKLIFVGYIFLATLYIIIFGYVIYGAFQTGVYDKIKRFIEKDEKASSGIPSNFFLPGTYTSFGFFKIAFMLFFIVINTISWISSSKKGVGGNIWGAVLMPFAPILVYFGVNQFTGDLLEKSDMFKTILFFATVAAFIGLIIYNFISLTQVLKTLSERANKLKTYDLEVSKARMNELNGYSVSLYLAILSAMYIIHDSTTLPPAKSKIPTPDNIYPKQSSYITASISYLLFTVATITNYFNSNKIVKGLKNDSTTIIKKTPNQKMVEKSNEKVSNQNIVSSAFYGVLNFFNPANL